jgi:hypothetical protein
MLHHVNHHKEISQDKKLRFNTKGWKRPCFKEDEWGLIFDELKNR